MPKKSASIFYFDLKSFLINILLLIILIYIAIYVNDQFVRPFLGDVLVVIWLFYLVRSFLNISNHAIAVGVLMIAYSVEFSQYLQIIPWLGLENIKVINIVLGTTYDHYDLLAYTIGCAIVLGIHRIPV